jgi:hypothetical protein
MEVGWLQAAHSLPSISHQIHTSSPNHFLIVTFNTFIRHKIKYKKISIVTSSTRGSSNVAMRCDSAYFGMYRVIQEKMSILWNVIVSVIVW